MIKNSEYINKKYHLIFGIYLQNPKKYILFGATYTYPDTLPALSRTILHTSPCPPDHLPPIPRIFTSLKSIYITNIYRNPAHHTIKFATFARQVNQ
ncbi:MAG: hypothetical protein CSB06_03670 [Bacteroidia bacterium]|nr:MAG: hypothetical protein CSB06_03670 [Bacteroidia bacterium]